MELLVHICCGPCLIYPYKILKENNFNITGFFYNPNIHPESEYNLRLGSAQLYLKKANINMIEERYNSNEFFDYISDNEERNKRCSLCYELRLKKTAKIAKELNFEYFTTTLLVSPYQNHGNLRQLGEDIASKTGVKFFYYDFRRGFVNSRIEARENNLYLQKYCGCSYSIKERKINAVTRL
ncbi:MAG: epoxyqueuosine reductase QueH [Candidatus Omnitrophota bacterium]